MSNSPLPPQNREKFRKNSSVLNTNRVSKTDRGGTLKRLLLHTTPCLKEPGKARRKSFSAITERKAFPAPFCTQACARKASTTPPTPPSARLEIILQHGRSFYISGRAFSRRSSQFKWNHSLTCCSFADRILDNFFRRFFRHFFFDIFYFRPFYVRGFDVVRKMRHFLFQGEGYQRSRWGIVASRQWNMIDCVCGCANLFTMDEMPSVFKNINELADHDVQISYLRGCTELVMHENFVNSRGRNIFCYKVRLLIRTTIVCQKFFLGSHGIKQSRLREKVICYLKWNA